MAEIGYLSYSFPTKQKYPEEIVLRAFSVGQDYSGQ
jgi:hypothetical protein